MFFIWLLQLRFVSTVKVTIPNSLSTLKGVLIFKTKQADSLSTAPQHRPPIPVSSLTPRITHWLSLFCVLYPVCQDFCLGYLLDPLLRDLSFGQLLGSSVCSKYFWIVSSDSQVRAAEWTAPFILPELTTQGDTGFSLFLSPTLSWLTIKTSKVHQRSHCLQKRQEANPLERWGCRG